MEQALEKLKIAHQLYGHPVGTASFMDVDQLQFRMRLIDEERDELWKAIVNYHTGEGGIYDIYKELGDLLYVILGFAVTFGIPLDVVFDRIHASNMSKLGRDGKPLYREDGKVLKGPDYCPPQFDDLLGGC